MNRNDFNRFWTALRWLWTARDKTATRYALNGILWEGNYLVATDGRRMHFIKLEQNEIELLEKVFGNQSHCIFVPKNGKLPVKGDWEDNSPNRLGGVVFEQVEGRFPKWRDLIPDEVSYCGKIPTCDPQFLLDATGVKITGDGESNSRYYHDGSVVYVKTFGGGLTFHAVVMSMTKIDKETLSKSEILG